MTRRTKASNPASIEPDALDTVAALLPAVWFGLVVGVSFLATPAKFLAPTLELAVALDVGRHTFRIFAALEAALLVGALLLIAARRFRPQEVRTLGAIALLMACQYLWLLPILEQRVALLIMGSPQAPSYHHLAYALCEALKAAALLTMAVQRRSTGYARWALNGADRSREQT